MEERKWIGKVCQLQQYSRLTLELTQSFKLNTGFFMEPTIFTNVEDHMMLAKEESFGPVMIISIFENG